MIEAEYCMIRAERARARVRKMKRALAADVPACATPSDNSRQKCQVSGGVPKGIATIEFTDGRIRTVELHWYEGHGVGRKMSPFT